MGAGPGTLAGMNSRGTWRWWKRQLVSIAVSLEPEAHYVFDRELPIYVRNLSGKDSRLVVRAIRTYAQTRRWPPGLTADVTTPLDVRLRFGISYAHNCAAQRRPPPAKPFSEVFVWLLVDRFSRRRTAWADAAAEADFF